MDAAEMEDVEDGVFCWFREKDEHNKEVAEAEGENEWEWECAAIDAKVIGDEDAWSIDRVDRSMLPICCGFGLFLETFCTPLNSSDFDSITSSL